MTHEISPPSPPASSPEGVITFWFRMAAILAARNPSPKNEAIFKEVALMNFEQAKRAGSLESRLASLHSASRFGISQMKMFTEFKRLIGER